MSTTQDPPRLLDPSSSADPVLRDVLRVARSSTPTAAQLEALALKVGAATALHAGASAALDTRWLLGKASAAKVSAVLLIAGAATWLSWNSSAPSMSARTQPAASAIAVASAPRDPEPNAGRVARGALTRTPPLQPLPIAVAPARDGQQAPLDSSDVARPKTSASTPMRAPRIATSGMHKPSALRALPAELAAHPAEQAPAPAIEQGRAGPGAEAAEGAASVAAEARAAPSELTLLSRAQGLLAGDAQQALEIIDEHAQTYPHGQFAEEREALAIDALRRLGRLQEARARARAFLKHYPASPHRERITTWLR